jgi:C-terminal processing protease CtpA/Prc
VDVGVVGNELGSVLSLATGQTIHGLLGYSFLKRYRVVIDYPNQVLWLDPIPDYQDDRPFEYCHVGIQIERQDGAVVIAGVVAGSPAASAGIQPGDELTAIDGKPARPLDLMDLTRRLEGKPGTHITLAIRRDDVDHVYALVRRRLL